MGKLIPGGPMNDLPPNWEAPWGWPAGGDKGALWVGEEPATQNDLDRLAARGWTADEGTLCGIHAREWTAKQYGFQDAADLDGPWDTLPRPGGEGSLEYKTHLIPEGVDRFAKPGQWVFSDDRAWRALGNEPLHKVDLGGGIWEWHIGARPGTPAEGLEFEWDAEFGLWRVADQ